MVIFIYFEDCIHVCKNIYYNIIYNIIRINIGNNVKTSKIWRDLNKL